MFSLSQEWRRIFSWQQRNRLLVARFTLLVALTSLVALVGTVAIYSLEGHAPVTKNPLTTGGRVLNILFEIWGVLFVAGVTGAFATFFLSDDREA